MAHAKVKEAKAARAKVAHQATCVKGLAILQLVGMDTNKKAYHKQYADALGTAEVAQLNAPGPTWRFDGGAPAHAKGAPIVHPGARIIHCIIWLAECCTYLTLRCRPLC